MSYRDSRTQMALFGDDQEPTAEPSRPGDATQRAVLDLIAARRYALLPAEVIHEMALDGRDTVWIDGQANWCYLGLPDGHLSTLAALVDQHLIEPDRAVRTVRLANRPVRVTPYRLTSTGRELLAGAA